MMRNFAASLASLVVVLLSCQALNTRPTNFTVITANVSINLRFCEYKPAIANPGTASHRCHEPILRDYRETSHVICKIPNPPPSQATTTTTTTTTMPPPGNTTMNPNATTMGPNVTISTTPPQPPGNTTTMNPNATISTTPLPTPGNTTTMDPNATISTTTTTTPTTTTTTPTTTTTTTPTTRRPGSKLPHHGNICSDNTYFNVENITLELPRWYDRAKQTLIVNDEDVIRGQCNMYFRATLPELPTPDFVQVFGPEYNNQYSILDKLSCSSPFAGIPEHATRKDLVLGLNMIQAQKELIPVKQRRTENINPVVVENLVECLETWIYHRDGMESDPNNDSLIPPITTSIPIPENCLHCSGTVKFDNTRVGKGKHRDSWHEMRGEIVPFAKMGETCTLENEAYIHGAVMASIAFKNDNQDEKEKLDGIPWGKLHTFWPQLVNLYAGEIDKDDNEGPECSTQGYYSKLLHGDCVFNQRLATDPNEAWEDLNVTRYSCRGTHLRLGDINSLRHDVKVDMPIVGLGCAPHHFLVCDQVYNHNQIMESKCICHPLYSVENPIYNESDPQSPQCLPMAGVPCRFNVTENFGDILFRETGCADGMLCKNLTKINKEKDQHKTPWEMFARTFAGFMMSPIARDYMVSKAIGMCVCNRSYIQTPFNECLNVTAKVKKYGRGAAAAPYVVQWRMIIIIAYLSILSLRGN